MPAVRTVALGDHARAVDASAQHVWCVVGDQLLGFDAKGDRRVEFSAPAGTTSVAADGDLVVLAGATGWVRRMGGGQAVADRTVWSDVLAGRRCSDPELITGGGAVWVVDRATSAAFRLGPAGAAGIAAAGPPVSPDADRFAADGDRLWWTSRLDTCCGVGPRPWI